jgi:hypothetical protein
MEVPGRTVGEIGGYGGGCLFVMAILPKGNDFILGKIARRPSYSWPSLAWLDEAGLTKIRTERKIKWLNNSQTFSHR